MLPESIPGWVGLSVMFQWEILHTEQFYLAWLGGEARPGRGVSHFLGENPFLHDNKGFKCTQVGIQVRGL